MDPRLFRAALALSLLLALAPAAAEAGDAEPRLYTNADLETLDPLAVDSGSIGPVDGSGWESVAEFIAHEHARLDAGRSHDLDRRLVAIEEEESAVRRNQRGFGLSYPGHALWGYPNRPGVRRRGHGPRATTPPARDGRIVPLHARPSHANGLRSEAIQRSGRDAFPSRSGPSR